MKSRIVCFNSKKGSTLVKESDIQFCQALGRYTEIFTIKEKILVTKHLKDIESMLCSETFFRIHKSHLININYVTEYSSINNELIIGEKHFKISYRKKSDFLKKLKRITTI